MQLLQKYLCFDTKAVVLKLLSFLPTKLLTCLFSSPFPLPESLTLVLSTFSPLAYFPLNLKDTVFLTALIGNLCPPILPCNHKRLLLLSLLPPWASYPPFLAFLTSLSPLPVSLYCTKPILANSPKAQGWTIELLRLKYTFKTQSSRLSEDILNGLIALLATTGTGPRLVWEPGLLKGLLSSLLYKMWFSQ